MLLNLLLFKNKQKSRLFFFQAILIFLPPILLKLQSKTQIILNFQIDFINLQSFLQCSRSLPFFQPHLMFQNVVLGSSFTQKTVLCLMPNQPGFICFPCATIPCSNSLLNLIYYFLTLSFNRSRQIKQC